MRAHFEQPAFLYEATRVYLMLGSAGPLDRDLVKEWMSLDWQCTWPGPAAKPLRDSLERHLAALLDQPLEKVPLDGALIEDARRTFSRVTLAERVYGAIKGSQPARALPPWRPADAAGASGVRVFIRSSGAPLTEGVPGFYTVDGFYKVLLPNLPSATMQVASESWVLGKDAQIDPTSPQVLTLQRDVIALYTADYAKQWDALLADLDIEPMRNLPAGGAGAVHPGLAAVADARPAGRHHPPAYPDPAAAAAARCRRRRAGAAQARGRGGAGSEQRRRPAARPARRGQRAAAGAAGQGDRGPLRRADHVRRQGTGRTDRQRAEAAERSADAARQAGGRAGRRHGGGARRRRRSRRSCCRPRPAAIRSRWRAGCRRLRSAATSCAAAARWIRRRRRSARRVGRPRCAARRSTGRYPFAPGSTNDIPLDDFAKLFAAGGLLDKFFNDNLQTFVDTSGADLEGAAGGRRRAAGHAGRSRAVPARVADPRPVLRRRRQSADRAVRHHADRYRRQAGDARPRRAEHRLRARADPRRRR